MCSGLEYFLSYPTVLSPHLGVVIAVEAAPAVPVHGGGGGARGGGVQTARTTSLVTSLQDDGGVILTLGRPVGSVVAGGGPAELEAVRVRGLYPAYSAVTRLSPVTPR